MTPILLALKAAAPYVLPFLPTILVGMSKSPKTAGIASKIMKVIQLLSVVTHSDHPGTFKLPLSFSVGEGRESPPSANGAK